MNKSPVRPGSTHLSRHAYLRHLLWPGVLLATAGGLGWAIAPYHRTGNEGLAAIFIALLLVGSPLALLGVVGATTRSERAARAANAFLGIAGVQWVAGYTLAAVGLEDAGLVVLLTWAAPFLVGLIGLRALAGESVSTLFRVGWLLSVLAALAAPAAGFLFEIVFVLLLPGSFLLGLALQRSAVGHSSVPLLFACLIVATAAIVGGLLDVSSPKWALSFLPFGVSWIPIARALRRPQQSVSAADPPR